LARNDSVSYHVKTKSSHSMGGRKKEERKKEKKKKGNK